jgi:hypothetical protein
MVVLKLKKKFDGDEQGVMTLGVTFLSYTPEQLSCSMVEMEGLVETRVQVELTRCGKAASGGSGVPESGKVELQLCGQAGKMEVGLEWRGSQLRLFLEWSSEERLGAAGRLGAAVGSAGAGQTGRVKSSPTKGPSTPTRRARRARQTGVQTGDGGLAAVARKLGFGGEIVFGMGELGDGMVFGQSGGQDGQQCQAVEGACEDESTREADEVVAEIMRRVEREVDEEMAAESDVVVEEIAVQGVGRGAVEVMRAVEALEKRKEELAWQKREAGEQLQREQQWVRRRDQAVVAMQMMRRRQRMRARVIERKVRDGAAVEVQQRWRGMRVWREMMVQQDGQAVSEGPIGMVEQLEEVQRLIEQLRAVL